MTSVDGTVSRGYSKLVQRGKYVAALYRPPAKSRSILVSIVRAQNCAEEVQSAQLISRTRSDPDLDRPQGLFRTHTAALCAKDSVCEYGTTQKVRQNVHQQRCLSVQGRTRGWVEVGVVGVLLPPFPPRKITNEVIYN